jgi:outer membrane protein assembly factor BamB
MGRRNSYPHAPQSLQSWLWQMLGAAPTAPDGGLRPQTLTELTLFGDQVPQLMTVDGDLVFNLEGPLSYMQPAPKPEPLAAQQQRQAFFAGAMPETETSRKTWLAAYELSTGKLRWHRSPSDGEEAALGGFAAAPVPLNELLVVAVNDGQKLSLLAFDRLTSATRWRTALCDLPASGIAPWSSVGLAVDRGDVFVSTGAGTVFFVNGLDGSVRQAVTYPRKLPATLAAINPFNDGNNTPASASRADCRENRVIPVGDLLIVLATDFDHLFALDRRTGGLRWEAPLAPQVRTDPGVHCLGLAGRMLIMAGPGSVRGYDLRGGRIVWEATVSSSYGRGAVTDQAVYVPETNNVVAYHPETGAKLGTYTLMLADGAPVGNLFADGDRLVMLGAGTVTQWCVQPPESGKEETP